MASEKAQAAEQNLAALVNRLGLGQLLNVDGNVYGAGRSRKITTTALQTISSTSAGQVGPLSWPVVANQDYQFEGRLRCTIGPNATVPRIAIYSPTINNMRIWFELVIIASSGESVFTDIQTTQNALANPSSVNLNPSVNFTLKIWGAANFSAAGTAQVMAACQTSSANTWNVANYSSASMELVMS